MRRRGALSVFFSAAALSALFFAAGCHSYHIDATIENRTGAAVNLLEVDYPSASFGVDTIAAGADFHYRINVTGDGPLTVAYTASGNKQVKLTGPDLAEREQGRLEIVLLPAGKVEFHTRLSTATPRGAPASTNR